MNANRYRLIFDKRTGMLVPVAEFTSSAKKGSSRGIGDGMGDTSTPKWSQLCFAMALAASGLGAPRVLNAQMIPDGTTQTTVTQTSNGLPLVNIADPNASGLSHNKFTDFNVDARGAVFNNSQVDANTRMGGQALKNPHLTNNASAILTEITGNNTSHLLGSMEVHGAPADLIIANPNGIFVNDVAVLGANNLTLTTGKPDALGRKFEVHGGNIEIGAGGLSTENLNYFDIVARSIALHGEIQGGANAEGRLAAGLNTLDRGTADRPITKREDGGGAGAPAFAIQGSAVGAMHGSHVTLLSTESGVGVRHEGRIISSTDIQIDVNGDLRVRRMEAQQNAFLKGHNVSLGGEGDTMEAPSAKVNHWLRVNADGDLRLQGIYNLEKAQFTATGTLTSEGAHVNALRREYNTHGRIEVLAGRLLVMAGVRVTETRLIDLGDELGGGIGIASRGVPGAQSVDLYKDAAARAAVREHFVAHAFIANWDAIGITGGNYVRDAAGALVSIDHGGALRYRGAGAPKGSAFESTVGEMQSMLKKDPLTKHIFRELSLAEVRAGLKRVVAIPDAAILSLVERYGPHDDAARAELGRTLLARKADLRAYQEKLGEPPADLAKVQAAERARGEAFLRAQSEEVAAASNVLSSLTADELGMLETLHERNWTDFMDKRGEQTTKFDFRGDSRKPSEIFARGFEPWARWPNADADTAAHQKEVDRERSNIVSLSKLPSRATGFATNFGTRTEGHLYVTHGLKGLDLFRRLPISIRSFEHEIAVPDGVPPHHILGAYDVDLKGIVPGSFQVNPGFETEADRAGFAARQKTLLGHHALVASSLDDVQDQSWWHREPGLEAMLRDHRASLEWRLEGLYREQKDSARREANRREFTDTTLKE